MNRTITAFLIIGISIFSACGEQATRSSQTASVSTSEPSTTTVGGSGAAANTVAAPAVQDLTDKKAGRADGRSLIATKVSLDQSTNAQIDTAPTDRKIIRNAELSLEADSPEKAQKDITAIAEQNGGFVVESQQSSSDNQVKITDVVTMSIRVPSQKFGETLDAVRKTSSRVIVESVKGSDVTEEFIDIEARLKAQKALEQQFVEIMRRANSVDEALDVQRQLADVRGEIEKIEGRKRFLENQSALSTIKIRLQTPAVYTTTTSAGFGHRLAESFGSGFDFAMSFVLGLVTFVVAILPFALIFGLPTLLLARYFVKRVRRTKTVNEIVREEIASS